VDLAVASGVFLASAVAVFFLGTRLAVYGDALASLTGWGRLFVGSILLAFATSLPEVSNNISAVRLDPPNPALAIGDALGSNMFNMLILSLVALYFGGNRFLQRVAPEQGYLIVLAAIMTGVAVLFGAVKLDVSLWQVGLSSVILIILYAVGMRVVYVTRPSAETDPEVGHTPEMTLGRAWIMFGLVSMGVIAAGFFLAWSSDQVAQITGIASSTLGILAVSLVTSMPEVSTTIAAARMGAMDLGVAGLFGSCAFNITILSFADFFYREDALINQTEPAHLVAGGVALVLIFLALALVLGRDRLRKMATATMLVIMALIWIVGAVLVGFLGAAEDTGDDATVSLQHYQPEQPGR
jgi:cation:H+ antiporter